MMIEAFEQQVASQPDKIALWSEEGFITYNQLNRYANRIARVIAGNCPPPPENHRIGLLFDHGPDMIAAILGTLKAGAVYVPLSPAYPEKRIAYMLTDSKSSLLLTQKRHLETSRRLARENGIPVAIPVSETSLTGTPPENSHEAQDPGAGRDSTATGGTADPQNAVIPGKNPPRQIKTSQLAYIMYTSGSTGKPKGVMQTHENIMYYTRNWTRRFSISPGDRMTLFSSFCHDGSIQDLFSALLNGAILYPYDMRRRDESLELSLFLIRERITIWHSVPSLYSFFANTLSGTETFRDLRFIILGGEPVRKHEIALLKKFFPYSTLANVYGQTESSVNSIWMVAPGDNPEQIVIGQPLEKTQIFVINEQGNPVEPLENGEILIVCPHLSPGYWQNKEASETTFGEEDGFGRLYWTGDLGCLLPGGEIEFLGRKDFQVKIRGFRVEPGEIETLLLNHPQVKEAVVTAREDRAADKCLCAYITSPPVDPTLSQQLRDFLSRELPDYMIPAHFITLPAFPLTQSGKIDRKALPAPEIRKEEGITPPRDFIEEKMREIWAGILGLEKEVIGIDSNFFELGGHSLKATTLVSRLHRLAQVKISLAQVFKIPTIRALSAACRQSARERYQSIRPAEKKEYYELSPAQKRLYILQQMQLHSTGYNMPRTIPLTSDSSSDNPGERLEKVFNQLIARHESLRTSFTLLHDRPVQRVHPKVDFIIQTLDLNANGTGTNNPALSRNDRHQTGYHHPFVRPFDLSSAPLLRVMLLKEANRHYRLLIDMHHIITDGTSQVILTGEFQRLYEGNRLPPLKLQYKDYARWQGSEEQQVLIMHQRAYWLEIFPASHPVLPLELPTDRPRPATWSYDGGSVTFRSTPTESHTLRNLAKQARATPFMVILAVWNVLLAKLGRQEDIVIGTPVAARRHQDLEPVIGMFVNTLALRNYPRGEKTFLQFLTEVKQRTLQAFENQEYQFEDLVDQLSLPRDTGRNPLFDVVINLLNQQAYHNLPGLQKSAKTGRKPSSASHHPGTAKFDLTINVAEGEVTFLFLLEYAARLFDPGTIDRIIRFFRMIMAALRQYSGQQISGLEILPLEEKQHILYQWNNTRREYPRHKTIPQGYAEQARRTPGQIALLGTAAETPPHKNPLPLPRAKTTAGEVHLSYQALYETSHRLAARLKERGLAADNIAAIMVETSPEMVIGILGILEAGGAYLPIDPAYPRNRVNNLLTDSSAAMRLTRQDIRLASEPPGPDKQDALPPAQKTLPSLPVKPRDHQPATSLAYIIYTSGSTGSPKGVMVSHRSVIRLVKNTNFVTFSPSDRLLQTGALNFDASTFEIWGSLLNGLTLCLIPKYDLVDAWQLKSAIRRLHVTLLWMTSPLFNRMLPADSGIFQGLKTLLLGGDVLSPPLIRQLKETYPQLNVINGYGPTENTTFSTTHPITLPLLETIPIGKPIANSTAYILDPYGYLQPVGVPGELAVGGDGLARGYLNNPELTAEKFCLRRPGGLFLKKPPPWTPRKNVSFKSPITQNNEARGEQFSEPQDGPQGHYRLGVPAPGPQGHYRLGVSPPLYHTGDLARWLPDGTIAFLGRLDFQVKIRGFRIEPAEIEQRLLSHPQVHEALVIARSAGEAGGNRSGEKYLCAYITNNGSTPPSVSQLQEYLAAQLPDYMVPAEIVLLEKMPLNPHGKIDYRSLPEPGFIPGENYTPPGNEIETKLVALWEEILAGNPHTASTPHIGIHDNFFARGGHSLKATTLAARIHKIFDVNIPLLEIFRSQTVKQLADYIKNARKETYVDIKAVEKRDYYPLSYIQELVWNIESREPGNVAFNIPGIFTLDSEIRVDLVKKVLQSVLKRHPALRTGFQLHHDQPVQRIKESLPLPLTIIDISSVTAGEKQRRQQRILERESQTPFDLSQPPLIRIIILIRDKSTWDLIYSMHHIISDGWSIELLKQEFLGAYQALRQGKPLAEPPLPLRYLDVVYWQKSQLADPQWRTRCHRFWKDRIAAGIPQLVLPADWPHRRTAGGDRAGAGYGFMIGRELKNRLQELGRQQNTTLSMVMFSMFLVSLAHLTGQEKITCLIIDAGREHAADQQIIGLFINPLLFSTTVTGAETVIPFLQRINREVLETFQIKRYPPERVFRELNLDFPDVPVAYNMLTIRENLATQHLEPFAPYPVRQYRDVKYEMEPYLTEYRDGIHVFWAYRKNLFSPGTIAGIAGRYIQLLEEAVSRPRQSLNSLLAALKTGNLPAKKCPVNKEMSIPVTLQ